MKIDIKGVIVPNDNVWIYDYFGIENTSPKAVLEVIEKAKDEKLDIYINSGGGNIFAGSEIYSAIREYRGQVNINIVGMCASAASVIACAGHSEISPTAMLMVHNVACNTYGNYHDMDKQSEILQKANETIANAYVAKTGMSMEEALEMMDKETWLSAQDAVNKKLVDKISEPKNLQLTASFNGGVLPQEVIDKMMNIMPQLKKKQEKEQPNNEANNQPENEVDFLMLKNQIELEKSRF